MIRLSKSVASGQWSVAKAGKRVLKTTNYGLLTTDPSIT